MYHAYGSTCVQIVKWARREEQWRQEERNSQSSSALELLLFLFKSRDPQDSMNKPILQSVNCDDSINGGDNGARAVTDGITGPLSSFRHSEKFASIVCLPFFLVPCGPASCHQQNTVGGGCSFISQLLRPE